MANRWGPRSKAARATCSPNLQRLADNCLLHWNCSVLEGHRGEADQNLHFNAVPQRSKVKFPDSKHNAFPSKAIHLAPYPLDWEDLETWTKFGFYVLGVADSLGIKIRWGRDWDRDGDLTDQTFNDYAHFEEIA